MSQRSQVPICSLLSRYASLVRISSLQSVVWRFLLTQNVKGGLIVYTADVLDQVNLATAEFAANNNDSKVEIVATYNHSRGQVSTLFPPKPSTLIIDTWSGVSKLICYDAPSPRDGAFDKLLVIPSLT